jgi:hypothetical protein
VGGSWVLCDPASRGGVRALRSSLWMNDNLLVSADDGGEIQQPDRYRRISDGCDRPVQPAFLFAPPVEDAPRHTAAAPTNEERGESRDVNGPPWSSVLYRRAKAKSSVYSKPVETERFCKPDE